MNAQEIRSLEQHLTARPELPLSDFAMQTILRRARRERAEHLAEQLKRIVDLFTRLAAGVRDSAKVPAPSGLRHG